MVRPTCRAAARTGTIAAAVTCSARSRQDSMKCVFHISTSTRAVSATGSGMATSRRQKCSSRQVTPAGVLSGKYRTVKSSIVTIISSAGGGSYLTPGPFPGREGASVRRLRCAPIIPDEACAVQ